MKIANKWLDQALKAHSLLTTSAIIWRILFAASWVLMSYSLSWLLDGYNKGSASFNKAALIVIGLLLCMGLVAFISDLVRGIFIKKTNLWVRKQITKQIVDNSEDLLSPKNTGKKISWYLNDVEEIEKKYYANLIEFAYNLAMIILALVAIIFVHWVFAVAALIIFLVTLLIPHFVNKFVEVAQKKLTLAKEEYTEGVRDNLESIYTLFVADKLNYFKQRMDKQSEQQEGKYLSYNITLTKTSTILFMVNFLSQSGLIIFALYVASLGYATPGSALSIGALAGNLFNGVQGMMQAVSLIASVSAITNKYQHQEEHSKDKVAHVEKIVFQNVTFNYGEKTVIKDFSFNFAKKKYALKGESGSGKSTLMKLMLGINQSSSGQVLVDNKDIKSLDLRSYFKRIAYIEQNVYLLNESIKENILLGSVISEEKLNDILHIAKLDKFVASLPQGLDSRVSSNGQEISGGEKQRIAIARALVKDADFFFIDEATSQLDPVNRADIESILLSLPNTAVVMISHNFDAKTLAKFDDVIDLTVSAANTAVDAHVV